ncbi:MAG: pyridoxamine 5'-phosphate oxidase family protein [Chitinophagaceae bacterium]
MLGTLQNNEIEEVLGRNFLGRIGCRQDGQIYILPVYYHYAAGSIILRSYEGLKIEIMRHTPEVCFEVEEIRSFNDWKTVLCWGKYEELNDEVEIETIKRKLSDSSLAAKAYTEDAPNKIIYYRIPIVKMSGRFSIDS